MARHRGEVAVNDPTPIGPRCRFDDPHARLFRLEPTRWMSRIVGLLGGACGGIGGWSRLAGPGASGKCVSWAGTSSPGYARFARSVVARVGARGRGLAKTSEPADPSIRRDRRGTRCLGCLSRTPPRERKGPDRNSRPGSPLRKSSRRTLRDRAGSLDGI